MENKQTAVDLIYNFIDSECEYDGGFIRLNPDLLYDWIIKAKAMEKEQIEKAYESGCIGEVFELNCNHSSEQYYNENYGK